MIILSNTNINHVFSINLSKAKKKRINIWSLKLVIIVLLFNEKTCGLFKCLFYKSSELVLIGL